MGRNKNLYMITSGPGQLAVLDVLWLFPTVPWVGLQCVIVLYPEYSRVKSGTVGQRVNSDIRLHTVKIQMRRLIKSRLIRSFTVCLVNLIFIPIIQKLKKQCRCPNLADCPNLPDFSLTCFFRNHCKRDSLHSGSQALRPQSYSHFGYEE